MGLLSSFFTKEKGTPYMETMLFHLSTRPSYFLGIRTEILHKIFGH
jgi:hypothetical protein